MNFWAPHCDPHRPRLGTRPERYALRVAGAGVFLAVVGADQHIQEVSRPEQAFQFHTHQGALRVAREIGTIGGRRLEVVKVL